MNTKLSWMILGVVMLNGCDLRNESKAMNQWPIVNAVDETLSKVAHPEFANWSRFPEKSFVVRKRVVSNSGGSVIVITKLWLERKDENAVSVGSQVTVQRSDQPDVENGADIVSYPATYRLPKGMDEARFLTPSNKAKETGAEIIEIGKLKFKTKIFEWEESNETGPMTVKLWRSDEMPGKIVRQELFTKSTSTKSIEEVTELNLGN